MKITILGTGTVGQTLAAKLDRLGHSITIGTRDPAATLARQGTDAFGNPPYQVWATAHPKVELEPLSDAAARGEVIINALAGAGSIDGLTLAGEANLAGKIVLDLSNPLDFSKGMPPSLFVSNTSSLGEQLQERFPAAKIVKTLNTVSANLMVDPGQLAGGDHTMFVAGNDPDARRQTVAFLREWFGWRDVVELGDITTARGTEMLLPLWLRTWNALKTPMFSFRVVR
jgi:8-hydroxy-5-deazaflavin:NADPH oxidoreductase